MKKHHPVRRLALQGLCCLDVQGPVAIEPAKDFIGDCKEPVEVIYAARELMLAAFKNIEQCDTFLKNHCRHWELNRLALVDRGILRLAVHELLTGAVQARVVISEAIKLAKEFSTAESPRFVNGVLDAILKELQADGVHTD